MRARLNRVDENTEVFSAVNHYLDKAIKDMNKNKNQKLSR
jgi:hypothetical protein